MHWVNAALSNRTRVSMRGDHKAHIYHKINRDSVRHWSSPHKTTTKCQPYEPNENKIDVAAFLFVATWNYWILFPEKFTSSSGMIIVEMRIFYNSLGKLYDRHLPNCIQWVGYLLFVIFDEHDLSPFWFLHENKKWAITEFAIVFIHCWLGRSLPQRNSISLGNCCFTVSFISARRETAMKTKKMTN